MINENLEKIFCRVKTPSYVLDLDRIRSNILIIRNSISYQNVQIHYAMFSNDNEELLRLVKNIGLGILALNENEIELALRLGFSKEQINLTGGTFTKEKLAKLLSYGVDINLDSLAQLELAGQIARGSEVGMRIRLYDQETKGAGEGISLQDIEKTKEIAEKHKLRINGLQTYLGTNILDEQTYLNSAWLLTSVALQFPDLRYINIGGGFGIPYSSKDRHFNWDEFGKKISTVFEEVEVTGGKKIHLKMEPGRSIVGNAGYFITKVIEVRNENTLVVDASYANFARPFFYHTNHRLKCIGKKGTEKTFKIRGCTINNADYLSRPEFEGDAASLPQNIQEGDILCFRDAGAYSSVMQMDFLHHKKAPTLLINNGKLIE